MQPDKPVSAARAALNARRAARIAAGLCTRCGRHAASNDHRWCPPCVDSSRAYWAARLSRSGGDKP